MSPRLIVMSAALLLALSAYAFAQHVANIDAFPITKLVTPQLRADSFVCSVVNVGNVPLNASVKIYNENGEDITTFIDVNDYISCGKGPVAPNQSCEEQAQGVYALAHCRISFWGDPNGVRAALQAFTNVADRYTSAAIAAH
jgi:hypothetical protein